MKKLLLMTLIAAAVTTLQAQNFVANLTTAQEPGTLSGNPTGFGSGNFTLTGTTLSYSVTYSGLTGVPSSAHIHNGAPGTVGGVVFGFTANGTLTAASGAYSGSGALTSAQVTDLLSGKLYANIHTALNGGGEIRGVLVAVPEPTTLALGALGLGALAFARRRE